MFDFSAWLQSALAVAAGLLGINVAIVRGMEYLGLSGKAQAAFAMGSGFLLGVGSQLAFWGIPEDFLGWFLAVLFGLVVAGGSIGTYEAIKSAAKKANGM